MQCKAACRRGVPAHLRSKRVKRTDEKFYIYSKTSLTVGGRNRRNDNYEIERITEYKLKIAKCVIQIKSFIISHTIVYLHGPESRSRYSDSLRAGRSGDGIPQEARFSAPVQTGSGAHPASHTIDTGSFLEV